MANVVQVFVSSTRVDLLRERRAAENAIRSLGLHFSGMEYFGARAIPSVETCLEEVQACDIFVLVIGSRYGTYVPNTKISFTEREYIEAVSLNKPCLVFFKKSAKPKLVEKDVTKLIALQRFKQQLRERWQVAEFGTCTQLVTVLASSLSREVRRLEGSLAPASGIARGFSTISNELNSVAGDVISRGVPRERLLNVATEEFLARLSGEASRPPTVFVSHLETESEMVLTVAQQLRGRGILVIANSIPSTRTPGWVSTISEVIGSLDCFLPVLSRRSIDSGLARAEREQAILVSTLLPNKLQVVPIRVNGTPVPAAYRDHRVLDFDALGMDAMVAELSQILSNNRDTQPVDPTE